MAEVGGPNYLNITLASGDMKYGIKYGCESLPKTLQ